MSHCTYTVLGVVVLDLARVRLQMLWKMASRLIVPDIDKEEKIKLLNKDFVHLQTKRFEATACIRSEYRLIPQFLFCIFDIHYPAFYFKL